MVKLRWTDSSSCLLGVLDIVEAATATMPINLFLSRLARSLQSSFICFLQFSFSHSLVMHARTISTRRGKFFHIVVVFLMNLRAFDDEMVVVTNFSILVIDRKKWSWLCCTERAKDNPKCMKLKVKFAFASGWCVIKKDCCCNQPDFYNKKKHSVYITNEEKGRQTDR